MGDAPLLQGRYRIVDTLGRGASATTFLAEDAQHAGRRIALKALKAKTLGEWKQLELFEREARVLGGLRHHGVPELFGYFEHEGADGPEMCLALEWIEGTSLATRIKDGPRLDQVEVMQLASDLLDVLVYLHGRSPPVFHRDIKPSNILLRKDGTPVLIDFGGVCDGWRAPADSGDTIVGTVGYMPPEQYMGQVGPWSDLYALGATLLHLLTGRPPADHDFGAGRHALPPDLDVHPRLRHAVDAMLAPAPRDRPQTALEARRLLMSDAHAASGPAASGPAVASASAPPAAQALRDPPAAPRPHKPLRALGPVPRDPQGPDQDVYKAIRGHYTHPIGCLLHVVCLGACVLMLALELGLFFFVVFGAWIALGMALGRYNRAKDKVVPPDATPGGWLFVHGRHAVAEVFAREEREKGFVLKYRYDPEGAPAQTGQVALSTLKGIANPPGTRFGVLYRPEDPQRHERIESDLADET